VAYGAVLLALGLLAAGLLFKQLSQLGLLVAISIMISLPISAAAASLQRFHVPRVVGALLACLAGAAILGGILFLAIPAFVDQVNSFVGQLPTTVKHYEHALNRTFGLHPGTVSRAVQRFTNRYTQHPGTLLGPISSVGIGIATAVGALVVVMISAIYIAVSPWPLFDGFLRLFSPRHRAHAAATLERIRSTWLAWLRSVAVDMLAIGGLLFIGLRLDGLPFAVGFALFSALLTVIPNYGALIGAIPPIVFALTFSPQRALLVAAIYIVAYQLEGRLIPAAVRGPGLSLHPAVTVTGALVWGSLFGLLGLLVSVPLTALALILVDELWVRPRGSSNPGGRSFTSGIDPVPR
jgi:predicted PurR-regulated permease PerM